MADKKEICGTCDWWVQGQHRIIGECRLEMEGKPCDHVCRIKGGWKPKEIPVKPCDQCYFVK